MTATTRQTYGDLRTEEQKLLDAEVKERVQAGIAWLQETYGEDWVENIDLDVFDLTDVGACVLGQLYADEGAVGNTSGFDWAVDHLLGGSDASEYGFYTRGPITWDQLDSEWARAIVAERRRRRSAV